MRLKFTCPQCGITIEGRQILDQAWVATKLEHNWHRDCTTKFPDIIPKKLSEAEKTILLISGKKPMPTTLEEFNHSFFESIFEESQKTHGELECPFCNCKQCNYNLSIF